MLIEGALVVLSFFVLVYALLKMLEGQNETPLQAVEPENDIEQPVSSSLSKGQTQSYEPVAVHEDEDQHDLGVLPLDGYEAAFVKHDQPFLTYYTIGSDKHLTAHTWTRGKFWALARKAASVLVQHNIVNGAHFTLFFSGNTVEDLAFRLGAVMVGAVPVTVNWQADTFDRMAYKVTITNSKLIVVGPWAEANTVVDDLDMGLSALRERLAGDHVVIFHSRDLHAAHCHELDDTQYRSSGSELDTRIVIFTSGTTGRPKGVQLTYKNYECNRSTFESFLEVGETTLATVVVNPLHHTNSTAITDWAMRRPHAQLFLFERYTTAYWSTLCEVVSSLPSDATIVAPLVARHIDFLESLAATNKLGVDLETAKQALSRTHLLVGSAPVGPSTVHSVVRLSGAPPLVRFGSTETCLQVMGTPVSLSVEQAMQAFSRGWAHTYKGDAQKGYYIGRPHWPYTKVRVVRSVDPSSSVFLVECSEGEPGLVVASGDNVMKAYVGTDDDTGKVLVRHGSDVWYTGFGDVCFYLRNPTDNEQDFYWQARDSALLIKGGANYAYDQIASELRQFIVSRYGLTDMDLDVAVVGLRINSEHEDSCVVTVELADKVSPEVAHALKNLAKDAKGHVTKGSQPDFVRFDKLPRTFKGSLELKTLKKQCEDWAKASNLPCD